MKILKTKDEEYVYVSNWINQLVIEGIELHELGVFVRSDQEVNRAVAPVTASKASYKILDESVEAIGGQLAICTMHLAKGLEFKAVVVIESILIIVA